MAADDPRLVLDPAALQGYMELFGVAPVGPYTHADCLQYVEEYVHLMASRTHFTENIAFNIVFEGQLKLVLCLSSPTSTSVYNEQVRIMDEIGVVGIGDVYLWFQIGFGMDQYRFILLVCMIYAVQIHCELNLF